MAADGTAVPGVDLTGRAVLVSSASGIGAAAAALFASAGADVAVVDRAPAAVAEFAERHGGALAVEGDLTDERTCDGAVAAVLERYGRLDVLLNVAGLSGRRQGDGPVHEASSAGWRYVMDNNVLSTFQLSRAALRPMLAARAGVIVNTASVLGYSPASKHFATHAYAASKGAILALTKAMAAYYATDGVRVNAVSPGLIATPMSARAQGDPEIVDYLAHRQPLGPGVGAPEDVAGAMLYLASDAARFVTGQNLEVAGGWSVSG